MSETRLTPLPTSKQPKEEPQTKTEIPMVLLAARAKHDNHLDDNAHPAVRGISDRMVTDQLRSSERPNEPGHSLSNAEARICKQSWTNERHAAFVTRVVRPDIGRETLNAQVVPVNVIELEEEVQEFEPSQGRRNATNSVCVS